MGIILFNNKRLLLEKEKTRLNNLSTLFKDYPKKQKMVVARRLSESSDGSCNLTKSPKVLLSSYPELNNDR